MATYFNCFLLTATFDKSNCHLSGPQLPVFQLLMKKARKVMKFDSYREEKALYHVAMVAKFLDDNKPIKPLKSLLPNDYNYFQRTE